MKKILLIISISILAFGSHAQTNKLGFNFQKNQIFKQTLNANIVINQKINGQEMKINMMLVSKNSFKVAEVNDSNYLLNVTYDNLSLKMDIPGAPANSKIEGIMSKMTNSIKGKSFSMSISKIGKIIKINNIESIFINMFDSIADFPEAQKEQLKKQVMDAYGENNFKSNFETLSAIYPAYPVSKGNKWTIKNKMETSFSFTTETEYTLKDVTPKYYIISANAIMKTDASDSVKLTNGIPIVFNLNGAGTGELKIDKVTGWIIEAKFAQNMGGLNEIKDCEQIPGGMKIPMDMKIDMIISN